MNNNQNALALHKSSLLAHVEKKLVSLQTSPKQYYANLPVKDLTTAIDSQEPSLAVVKNNIGEASARALVVLAVSELVGFFNVGKTMNAAQVALTAEMILEDFWYLNIEEIKLCFRNAMKTAKLFDRLDGSIILGWLKDFDFNRDCEIEKQEQKKNADFSQFEAPPEQNSVTFEQYITQLKKQAENGSKKAMQELQQWEQRQHAAKRSKRDDPDKEKAFKEAYRQYRLEKFKKNNKR